jgi:membrane protease YdiL (CAAX protease family)
MDGQPTRGGGAARAPGVACAFLDFLRRPVLPERVTGVRLSALGATLRLFALDLAIMTLLVSVALVAWVLGFTLPSSAVGELKLGTGLIALIVVLAPIGEELIFRSWLSGRPGHVAAGAVLLAAIGYLLMADLKAHPLLLLGALAGGLVLAIGLAVGLRRRAPFALFARNFAWFFFASAAAFALVHLSNYSSGAAPVLLPLVLPQLLVGLILGYARVTYGLWSNILLHVMHNGLLIGPVMLIASF